MGDIIEISSELKISKQRGFPKDLALEDYINDPKKYQERYKEESVILFWNQGEIVYHPKTRIYLVEEMPNDLCLFWGCVEIKRQTITENRTDGVYKIFKLYDPEYQRILTISRSPKGKSYFDSAQQTP